MTYLYTKFGTTDLPLCNATQDLGMGAAATEYANIVGGGVYDALGGQQAQVKVPYTLPISAMIHSLTPASMRTDFRIYRALLGSQALLYRTWDSAPTLVETVLATFVQFKTTRKIGIEGLELSFEFEVLEPVWSGDAHTETMTLNATPFSQEIPNAGNAVQRDVVLTITAQGSNITDLVIENLEAGHVSKVSYGDVITAGQSLVIDCGVGTVRNNGVNDFANFTMEAGHTIDEFLRLMPGNNTIRVTRTGGSVASTCVLAYKDAWA